MPEISKFNGGFAGFSATSFSYTAPGGEEDEAAEYVGSTMLFIQNTTPTGWTRITSYDNHMLRVTSGNITTNSTATLGFNEALRSNIGPRFTVSGSSSWTFGPTTLTTPTAGTHTHPVTQSITTDPIYGPGPGLSLSYINQALSPVTFTSGGHSHPSATAPIASATVPAGPISIQYRDCILATRN